MPPQYNVSPSRGSGNRFPMPQQIYPQSVSHRVYTHDNDTIRHYHKGGLAPVMKFSDLYSKVVNISMVYYKIYERGRLLSPLR